MARLESLHPVCTPVHSAGLAATPARGPPGLARRGLPAPAPSSPCCCSGYSFSVCSSSAWNRGLLRGRNRHSPWPRLATLPPRRCPGLASCHALLVLGREAQPARPRPPLPPPHAAECSRRDSGARRPHGRVYLIVALGSNLLPPSALRGCGCLGSFLFLFHIRQGHFFEAIELGRRRCRSAPTLGSPPCTDPPTPTAASAPTSYSFSSVQLISSKSPIRLAAGRRWSKKTENSSCRWWWPLRRCHICVLSWEELQRVR